jgi:hypothetical protein
MIEEREILMAVAGRGPEYRFRNVNGRDFGVFHF